MLFAQGSNHTRLRGSVRDVFTPSFIDGLADGIQAIGADVIGYPQSGTPFDFMTEIALPLPIAVTSEWLGLDAGNSKVLRRESLGILRLLSAAGDSEDIAAGVAAFATPGVRSSLRWQPTAVAIPVRISSASSPLIPT